MSKIPTGNLPVNKGCPVFSSKGLRSGYFPVPSAMLTASTHKNGLQTSDSISVKKNENLPFGIFQ